MRSDKSLAQTLFPGTVMAARTSHVTVWPRFDDPHSKTPRAHANTFMSRVNREIRRALRTRCDLSLALFTFDGGMPDAAAILDSIATRVARSLRETDEFAILGNRLVVVLLLETNLAGASTYAERMLRAMALSGVTAHAHSHPSPAFDDLLTGRLGSHYNEPT